MRSFILFMLMSFSAIAGDHVGSGGGIAEKNVVFARLNLERYIDHCLDSPACKLTEKERQLLLVIKKALPQELPIDKKVVFLKDKPGFFQLPEGPRIARTGNRVGDVVYFNQDLLYSKTKKSRADYLSLFSAVGIWIHELGHHHGIESHLALDLLGSKVELALLSEGQVSAFPFYARGIKATVINPEYENLEDPQAFVVPKNPYPQFILTDGTKIFNFSAEVEKMFKDKGCLHDDLAQSLRLDNLHWTNSKEENGEMSSKYTSLWASSEHFCKGPKGTIGIAINDVEVKFEISRQHNFKILGKPEVKMHNCTTHPKDCH